MRVAIIGAGMAGLACAFELQKHGITPVIYERSNCIGDSLDFSSIWPRIFNRPQMEPLAYFREKYQLQLTPLANMRRIEMISPKKRIIQRGSLGYIFKRGREPFSMDNQIASKVNAPIYFDRYIELNDIRDKYDHIVVANALSNIPSQLGIWTDTFITYARVAHIVGRFRKDSCSIWFNTEYAKNSFAYMIPNSEKEASLVLIVNGITHQELDYYWRKFMEIENIQYPIINYIDAMHNCGFVDKFQIDNIYIAGNSAGLTDDLLGCGSLNAIESGIFAARAIAENKNYTALVEPIANSIKQIHELRKVVNTMQNKDFDSLLTFVGVPVVKRFIYNNPYFKVTQLENAAKLYNEFEKRNSTYS